MRTLVATALGVCLMSCAAPPGAGGTRETATYRRVKAHLDAVPAIDTHDHLLPFDRLPAFVETEKGRGANLAGLWRNSYLGGIQPLPPWKPGQKFADWWVRAKADFQDVRATSFYRYQLPAYEDLYGVDFDRITDAEAAALNDRVFEHYKDPKWLYHVITERANIELLFNDPWWARLAFTTSYPFEVLVFNVTTLVRGFHPSEYQDASDFHLPFDDPYRFARENGIEVTSLDGYVALLDRLFAKAKAAGAVCLKTTLAYQRPLRFENVPPERAAKAFGKPRKDLTADEIRDFEDFVMWRLVERSARYDLPFQIHTGHGRIPGSNPMLLIDLIAANPKTKFILFHGGYPWVSEIGAMVAQNTVIRRSRNVWLDSVWLPMISYTLAKRAFHEWLEVMPSDRILWGADCNNAEGIYGATEFTRRCLAEVLAEKVDRGDLGEGDALRIGRQILRDNALKLFPSLNDRLWKHKGRLEPN
jgi:uncharacterized protein